MFFKKRESPEEKAARLDRIHAEMAKICEQGKDEYDKLVAQVQSVLEKAEKPPLCNTVRFAEAPYLFPKLKSYQYYTDWEVWRSNDSLYFYCAEVEDYPQQYYGGDAPAIARIPVDSIQHFRVHGSTYAETKVSGGQVSQSRRTGRIKQTVLRSTTIQHDTRIVKLSILVNGVVNSLDLEYPAFDIMCALIPEKEHK